MNLTAALNHLAQKLLYVWVRSSVIPDPIEQLGIDPDKPIVYILYQRSWSNLLVLTHETQRLNIHSPLARINTPTLKGFHSVYTIAPKMPFKAWLLNKPKRSAMLHALIHDANAPQAQDIQLVPVTFFWGRPVAKQKHWLTLLFADSWQLASRIRKFFTIVFHGKNTLVTFSRPISLRSLIDSNAKPSDSVDSIQHALTTRLVEMKTAALGPDISHRSTLIRKILSQQNIKQAIALRAEEYRTSDYRASLQARKYLREIVADCTGITIQVMQRLLTAFWNRFYSGIDIHHKTDLATLALTHELIYVPCHRSHVDYLLLSYLIHSEGLAIPYIAAGKNLNMPVIGSVLRGGGAFFIRRTFKGNALYASLMNEYIATLVAQGMPLEYFIEGGRSRTGRLLKPKVGMLAMTVRGYLKYHQKPVAFIPVNIGYEKLIESKAYLAELAGEDKKSETLLGSLTAIFKLHGKYGRVSASFGNPVFLNDALEQHNKNWKDYVYADDDKPKWLNLAVEHIATSIMRNINCATAVNATHMIACILLATPKQTMDEKQLAEMVLLYNRLLKQENYSKRITLCKDDPAHQIKHTESLKLIKRRQHELGDIIYLDDKQSVALTYYRNNILHLFAMPSIIACCFLNMRTQTREQITNLVSIIFPFLKTELFLNKRYRELNDEASNTLKTMSKLGLLIRNEQLDVYTRPSSGTLEFTQLNMLSRIISPVLEVYYMTLALLTVNAAKPLTRQELEHQSVLMAQRISMMNESNAPDYFDRKLISNFVDNLISSNYLKDDNNGELKFGEAFHTADKHARLLLSRATRTNILQMLKPDNLPH